MRCCSCKQLLVEAARSENIQWWNTTVRELWAQVLRQWMMYTVRHDSVWVCKSSLEYLFWDLWGHRTAQQVSTTFKCFASLSLGQLLACTRTLPPCTAGTHITGCTESRLMYHVWHGLVTFWVWAPGKKSCIMMMPTSATCTVLLAFEQTAGP